MYSEEIKFFTELIKSEICGEAPSEVAFSQYSPGTIAGMYALASQHDIAHIIAVALKKRKLLEEDEISRIFTKSIHVALLRYELWNQEQNQIYEVFEKAGIVFVPLKGAVTRDYYAEPWMRTSSDIDILVRKDEIERATEVLVTELGYRVTRNNFHDIALTSPSNVRLELHFSILENEEKIDPLLEKVWNYVHPTGEGRYQYEMEPEYFIFHAYAHMLYHFLHGGCGVRFVIDIWLLKRAVQYDLGKLNQLFQACNIEKFVDYMDKLARIWFENEQHDETTLQIQEYILSGGLYGSKRSKVTAEKTKSKGRAQYMIQRIFVPFRDFSAMYPLLKKYPVLYPYYMVKRWMKILNSKIATQAKRELQLNREIEQKSVDALKELFEQLQL